MNTVPYNDEWGEEQLLDEQPQRNVYSDTEVLGRLCRMMDDDPLAFFVWTQRVLYRDRTYDVIAKRLGDMNPRTVTRQAIYDRIKKMLAKENGVVPTKMVMPKAKAKKVLKANKDSFEAEMEKYTRRKHENSR